MFWNIIWIAVILTILVTIGGFVLQLGCGIIFGIFGLIGAGCAWIWKQIKGE